MRHVESLWQLISVAGRIRDLTIERRRLEFLVQPTTTVYIDIAYAAVDVRTHALPRVLVETELQAGFGWRWQAEQDADGIYIVLHRRALMSGVARARVRVAMPASAHLILKLQSAEISLHNVTRTLHLPPDEPEL